MQWSAQEAEEEEETEARLVNCDTATFVALKVQADAPLVRMLTVGHKMISSQSVLHNYNQIYYLLK